MKNLTINGTYYVIDDLTNNVAQAQVTEINGDCIMLKATNSDMQYMRRNGNGIYATSEEAWNNRPAMPSFTDAELRAEESRYGHFDESEYIEF